MSSILSLSADQTAQLASMLAAAGYGARLPVYRAARAGRIAFADITRGASRAQMRATLTRAKAETRPVLVLLGDDDYQSTGPAGWPACGQIVQWAAVVWINAAAGDAHHYALAVEQARHRRRILFVETSSAMADAWHALARRAGRDVVRIDAPSAHPARPTVLQ